MRVPISWLKDFVSLTVSVPELAERLTLAGLEVEAIDYIGRPGGNDDHLVWDRDRLLVGQIMAVHPHPDADRLVLAEVDYGAAEPEMCVTGAPNLFPYLGQGDLRAAGLFSPFALEGAVLYDGHKSGRQKMTLKGRTLRGIYNRSMVCSEKELGLSDEHEGVILMQGDYTPGTPLQDVLGDAVLDIAIIPNIARCASILGVAREVAALTGESLREPNDEVVMEGPEIAGRVVIRSENPDLNPRFVAMVISGVTQKPSPYWMQHRLRLAGQRPINLVVDISNYVMLEIGQPNHTFDYDFLRERADIYHGPEGPVEIVTRLPRPGEHLTTLDGIKRPLEPYTILVTDPASSLSLGGIMGGYESEIQPGTTNVLLEAAAWDYINIRRSSRALKIDSEAAFRFGRGVHPSQAMLGARRAAELMRRLAGGTVWQGIVDYYPRPVDPVEIRFSPLELRRLGGLDLSPGEIAALLRRLDFAVVEDGASLKVTAPDHRLDIEGPHDLVEEVCRLYGYDRLPATIMDDVLPPQRNNEALAREERIKDLLTQLGLQEIITYRLTTPQRENRLIPAPSGLAPDDRPYVTLANPISQDRAAMRHSVLASALEVVAANSRFQDRIALFELGAIYLTAEDGVLPNELRRLALVLTGRRRQAHWQEDGRPSAYDFFDMKGVVEALLAQLHLGEVSFAPAEHPTYRPGRCARFTHGDSQLGLLGELHPLVADAFEIRSDQPTLVAELDVEALLPLIPATYRVEPPISFPPVEEDLALVVDQTVPAARVEQLIRQTGGRLLRRVDLFDLYTGSPIPAGKKSLAYHLTFQAPDRTLTDREVRKQRERILRRVEQEIGARLRA